MVKYIDGESSAVLNKKGWFLFTYYQTKEDPPVGSRAHKLALEKARLSERDVALRVCKRRGYTVFEVWEHW